MTKNQLVEGVSAEVEKVVEKLVAQGPVQEPPTYGQTRTKLREKFSDKFPPLDEVFKAELFSISNFPPFDSADLDKKHKPFTHEQRKTVYEFFKAHPILLTYVPTDKIVQKIYRMLAWILYSQFEYKAIQYLDPVKEYHNLHHDLRVEYNLISEQEKEGKTREEIEAKRLKPLMDVSSLYVFWEQELRKAQGSEKAEKSKHNVETDLTDDSLLAEEQDPKSRNKQVHKETNDLEDQRGESNSDNQDNQDKNDPPSKDSDKVKKVLHQSKHSGKIEKGQNRASKTRN